VFRINYPPIANFEEWVGSKTTIELVNHHHARELAQAARGLPLVHFSPQLEPTRPLLAST